MSQKNKIAVLGAGSWGIALALVLDHNGHDVTLWEFRPDAAEHLYQTRDAKEFLPGIKIPLQKFILESKFSQTI